mmetsp:Transcript_7054/g.15574  ORF Transcript_7054/g.15574 Transcript_7054/m.15574 type:complete len:246 (+) Transcript_7054:1088-1825(+)
MRKIEKFAGNPANSVAVARDVILDIFGVIRHLPLLMMEIARMMIVKTGSAALTASLLPTDTEPTQKILRQRLLPLRPLHLLLHLPPFPLVLPPHVLLLAPQHLRAKIQRVLRHLVERRELFETLRILGGPRRRFEAAALCLGVVREGEGVVAFEDGLHADALFGEFFPARRRGMGRGQRSFVGEFGRRDGVAVVARMMVAVVSAAAAVVAEEGGSTVARRAPAALFAVGYEEGCWLFNLCHGDMV